MDKFDTFFRSNLPKRDKYLSRLFGLFGEEIVRTWCACPDASYQDLGRPTITEMGATRGYTLDFTLRRRDIGGDYVAELKCELEWDGYKYLTLTHSDQLLHHTGHAFTAFRRLAQNPTSHVVRRHGQIASVDGTILIWGAITKVGKQMVMKDFGFADVLSVEQMVIDLRQWTPTAWTDLLDRYRTWTTNLFDFLMPLSSNGDASATKGDE